MAKAKWIWYRGDYELYHCIKLHSRRVEYGADYPAFWSFSTPYPLVEFIKTFDAPADGSFKVKFHGTGYVKLDGVIHPENTDVHFTPGKHTVQMRVMNYGGLASAYIDSKYLVTDESWTATHGERGAVKAGCVPEYTGRNDNPEIFPFSYERKDPVISVSPEEGGILYDFGKEMFASIVLSGIPEDEKVGVFCGESSHEALAPEDKCCVWEYVTGNAEKTITLSPRAFRYIHIRSDKAEKVKIHAMYEYIPFEKSGSFRCDNPEVKKIWDTCAYTFKLCSREFFIDGIKRDRWVWGGDARQSFMIANYLYADREICKRTILAMLPKNPPVQHVNNINDYTMYVIMSVWEYYYSFGDKEFVSFVWERLSALYSFLASRLDENTGFVVARDGDWIFIDWSEMDKDGPVAAEQILLWHTENCMAKICGLLGFTEEANIHHKKADTLKEKINGNFWDDEKKAYIDSYTSGKRNVTRHANIFAMLFDFADDEKKQLIFKNVLKNDSVTQITTPYFKLYELMALCSAGDLEYAQKMLDSYWGAMLRLGATTIWEEYSPDKGIPECYAMYGNPYQKSLCHAWSCGPIYFLGRYCLGVYPTDVAYKTYSVEPKSGIYESFTGDVPTEKGNIHVEYASGKITVLSELDGGTLVIGNKRYEIEKGKPLTVEAEI